MPELVHSIEIKPAFFEIDAMWIVWHGHYVKYFELARAALLGKYGYGYQAMKDSGYVWPIIECNLKYMRPAKIEEPITVRAEVTEFEHRLRVEYLITNQQGQKLTRGYTLQVAVHEKTNEMQFVCPQILWDKLGVTP